MEKPDLTVIQEMSEGDEEFVQQTIEILLREFPKEREVYAQHSTDEDHIATAQIVHKIKHKISLLNMVESHGVAVQYEEELKTKSKFIYEQQNIIKDYQDKISKLPNREAASSIVYRCWELGLLLYYVGNSGNVLEITPPLVLTMDEIDEGTSILNQAFNDYIDGKIDQAKVAEFSGWFV